MLSRLRGAGTTPDPCLNSRFSPDSSTSTSTMEPLCHLPSRICSESGSSSKRWIARRSGRAPNVVSVPSFAMSFVAAGVRLIDMFCAIMRSRKSATISSTICAICSSVSDLNTIISSMRFKNSGLNSFFISAITRLLISLSESPAWSLPEKPSGVVCAISRAPTFDVMMMTVLSGALPRESAAGY